MSSQQNVKLVPIAYSNLDKMAQHVIEGSTSIKGRYDRQMALDYVANGERLMGRLLREGIRDVCLCLVKDTLSNTVLGAKVIWVETRQSS